MTQLPLDRPDPNAPPPQYQTLRERSPVARVTVPGGQPAWLVTSHEAVTAVLTDSRFSMSPPGPVSAENNTLFQDGEPHARLRRLVAKAFTARSITALRPRIKVLATEYAAKLAGLNPPADLIGGFAAPLSITTIGEVLGVHIEQRERFRELADAVNSAEYAFDEEGAAEAARAWQELGAFIATIVADKHDNLDDDLISAMIAVNDADDGRLDHGELIAMASTLITAGYSTTRNAIAAAVIRLSADDRLAHLAQAPETVSATVEEVLRHQSGQIGEPMPRWAQAEVTLSHVTIAPGDMVLVRTEAANRDPSVFDEPSHFDPDRRATPHVAFGRGPHHCLGAALARIELAEALTALSHRLPGLRPAGAEADIAWTRGIDVGLDRLEVTW